MYSFSGKRMSEFATMVTQLSVFFPSTYVTKNLKEEVRILALCDPLYKIQTSAAKEWDELKVDFLLGRNNVIYPQLIKDFACFIAVLEEIRKHCLAVTKSEKVVLEHYQEIFKAFDQDENWFSFILEVILTAGSGFTSEHKGVPVDLTEWKSLFWNTHKEKRAEFRSWMIKGK